MPYIVTKTNLPEVLILTPSIHKDNRGFFFESFNEDNFNKATGLNFSFVQDNHSKSRQNVLRGLHYQIKNPQGKLVRVVQGAVFDVAVDLRKTSPNFGKWVGVEISAKNKQQLWIPPGFAHGFIVLSASAEFLYKTTDYWHPEHERTLLWNDPTINIEWPINTPPIISHKDTRGMTLNEAEVFL